MLALSTMKLKGLIKLGISIVMLALILRSTNFQKLSHNFQNIPVSYGLLIIATYVVGQILSAFKWWNIARASGVHSSFLTTIKAYFIGMFVNCFGFGTVGGDLARGILITEGKPIKTTAVATVIADRAHGLATIALIGTVAIILCGPLSLQPFFIWILILFSVGIFGGWFLLPYLVDRFLSGTHALRTKIELVTKVISNNRKTLIYITSLSILFHCLQISLHKLIGYSLGLDIPWSYLFVFVPFINIVSTLPISWNGLGVREQAYAAFFVPAGILSVEDAVAFGTLWLIAVTICSAVGGLVAVMTKDFELLRT